MIISGTVKNASNEKLLPGAKVILFVQDKELAVCTSNNKGTFEYNEATSYIGETLTCIVEKEKFQTKKVDYAISEEEIPLEIELIPKEKPPPPPNGPGPWPYIVGFAVGIVAAIVIYFIIINANKPRPRPGPVPPPEISFFSADPSSIEKGESSTLSWETKHAETVFLDKRTGEESVALSGSTGVTPPQTTEYRLTAKNEAGETKVSCTVTVKKIGAPRILSFKAVPTRIKEGTSTTLSWETETADEVSLNDREVDLNGSITEFPRRSTEYRLAAKNSAGEDRRQCSVYVIKKGTPPPPKTPEIRKFEAAPSTINQGESSVLSWEFINADEGYIEPGIGGVRRTGSRSVQPNKTTAYILNVRKNGIERRKTIKIRVKEKPVTHQPTRWKFKPFKSPREVVNFLNRQEEPGPYPLKNVKICTVRKQGKAGFTVFYLPQNQSTGESRWKYRMCERSGEVKTLLYSLGGFNYAIRHSEVCALWQPGGLYQKTVYVFYQGGNLRGNLRWEREKIFPGPHQVVNLLNGSSGKKREYPLLDFKICALWSPTERRVIYRVYHQGQRLKTDRNIWSQNAFSSPRDAAAFLDTHKGRAEICAAWKNGNTEYYIFHKQ